MAPRHQHTFTLVPNPMGMQGLVARDDAPHSKPPMTSKQAQKLYREATRGPRLSKAEQRRVEREEQERIRRELEKDRQANKARVLREKKKAKEREAAEEKRRRGLPLVTVRPSQGTIEGFVRGAGRKREAVGLKERSETPEVVAVEKGDGGRESKRRRLSRQVGIDETAVADKGVEITTVPEKTGHEDTPRLEKTTGHGGMTRHEEATRARHQENTEYGNDKARPDAKSREEEHPRHKGRLRQEEAPSHEQNTGRKNKVEQEENENTRHEDKAEDKEGAGHDLVARPEKRRCEGERDGTVKPDRTVKSAQEETARPAAVNIVRADPTRAVNEPAAKETPCKTPALQPRRQVTPVQATEAAPQPATVGRIRGQASNSSEAVDTAGYRRQCINGATPASSCVQRPSPLSGTPSRAPAQDTAPKFLARRTPVPSGPSTCARPNEPQQQRGGRGAAAPGQGIKNQATTEQAAPTQTPVPPRPGAPREGRLPLDQKMNVAQQNAATPQAAPPRHPSPEKPRYFTSSGSGVEFLLALDRSRKTHEDEERKRRVDAARRGLRNQAAEAERHSHVQNEVVQRKAVETAPGPARGGQGQILGPRSRVPESGTRVTSQDKAATDVPVTTHTASQETDYGDLELDSIDFEDLGLCLC
ncbi:hypothetical protein NEMBOFW57_000096 [Staphylotrichum longicolle]|uniref:Uncharacterized protein n=1 Tax=Staphylotrichum longicolle TaxID=669026 RepID=A0AAD4I0L5_9PEZI|nr:hypothetical protein NEMBOFW57_000096 [Staphylotrichum longicolle]